MIVFVESNFVLELAFQQEEASDAQRIVELAEARRIELAVPACAFTEPYETLIRRKKERSQLLDKLTVEIAQLARSRSFSGLVEASVAVTKALDASGEVQSRDLESVICRLASCATVLPMTKEIVVDAFGVQQVFGLSPQDAFAFCAVDSYAKVTKGPKLFINRNHRDFLSEEIQRHFEQYSCELLPKFRSGRNYIESRLATV